MSILKPHVSLHVKNLKESVDFYQAMFGELPVKYKADYAKFDLANPPLNLTLELNPEYQSGGSLSHLGIQVETSEVVRQMRDRFQAIGFEVGEEFHTTCCYGIQDKVWITDPDNNQWEIFTVLVADTSPEQNLSEGGEDVEADLVSGNVCCS